MGKMKTYEFDTWAAFKDFLAEKKKTLKVDDEIIIRQPICKGAVPTTTFKVVDTSWEDEHERD